MSPADITNKTARFVKAIKISNGGSNANTVIVLSAGPNHGVHWFAPQTDDERRLALKSAYTEIVATGDKNVQLVMNANSELYNGTHRSAIEPSVDGTNPSDLGHTAMAAFWTSYFKTLP
jgi:hypothetical protein